jgi:RNA recognition motif-containing protein
MTTPVGMGASSPRERGASPPAAPANAGNGSTVYVGNLSGDTEREQLREAMSTFGRVATATVRVAAAARRRCGVPAPKT